MKRFSKNKAFSLYFRSQKEKKPRFLLAVGKNVFKKAVQRNLLKRRIRGIFLRNLNKLPKGKDFFVQALPSAALLNKTQLKETLSEFF